MTTLIIARHGNTFEKHETPTRCGARTDIPLTLEGLEQGKRLGKYLRRQKLVPDIIYASALQRAQQTAKSALDGLGLNIPVFQDERFNEIDYGPDENKPESTVQARLPVLALEHWNKDGEMPDEWSPRPEEIIHTWHDFADHISDFDEDQIVLVVTSNGIARFAPHITGDFEGFKMNHRLKLSTGALGIMTRTQEEGWIVEDWNIKP